MEIPCTSHDDSVINILKNDPEFTVEYLNAVLEDGCSEEMMLALHRLVTAFGLKEIAETANLSSNALYHTLSSAGNLELKSFRAILEAMGVRLAIMPASKKTAIS